MSGAVDPGWGDAFRRLPKLFVPTSGQRMVVESNDGLAVMRVLWVTFVSAVALLGVVVVIIDQVAPGGGADGRVVAVVVAAIGVFLQIVSVKFVPPIAGRTAGEVRERAQRAFFIRVAFAEPAPLVGFMGFVLSGNLAVYLVGAVTGLAGMYDAAPNSRWINEGDESLRASGSDVDFLQAMIGGGISR
jgi:hypothetical protein